MAHLNKRTTADGSARYDVRWRTPSGGVRTKTFRRRADADRFRVTVEADMLEGRWVDPKAGRVTFADYAERWLANRPELRPRTVELYRSLLDLHLLPTFAAVELAKIAPGDVRAWHAGLVRDAKPSVAPKAYRLLRAMMNTAVEDELVQRNPAQIKGAGVERADERPIATPAQVWALADAIEPRFRCAVLVAAFCGLRFGEVAGLARRHVNMLHGTITVERALVQHGNGRRELGPPKTDAGRRTVAMPAPLAAELERHLAAYVEADPDALVFVGERGGLLARGNWHHTWNAARKAVPDLPAGFRFHDLRHTSNTLAAAAGASTRELMARMGHASQAAAIRYQHATAERDAAIAASLGAALARPEPDEGGDVVALG